MIKICSKMFKVGISVCAALSLLIGIFYLIVPLTHATGGTLAVTDTLSSAVTTATADHEIVFTTPNTIPSGGQIKIDLPSSFKFVPKSLVDPVDVIDYNNIDLLVNDVQRSLGDAATYLTDGVTMGAHSIYFTLDGGMLPAPMGGEILAGTRIKVVVGLNVIFPTMLQSTSQFTNPDTAGTFSGSVTTTNASGETLATGTLSVAITGGTPPQATLVGITKHHGPNVTEGGATDSYTLWIDHMPTANVTINISTDSQVTVNPTHVTFTPDQHWSDEIPVTVTAVNDTAVEGSHTGLITHTVASADDAYNNKSVSSVTVNITDNDTAPVTPPSNEPGALVGITVSNHSTDVTEGGATDTYTIWLDHMPAYDVTVKATSISQVTVNPTSVTFTPSTWADQKTITVTAVDDSAVEGAHKGTVDYTVTSADPSFNGAATWGVMVNITDNDTAPQAATSTPPVVTATSTPPVDTPPHDTGTSTLKMGTSTPPTELKFSDVESYKGNFKLTATDKKNIYQMVNLMVQKKTYKVSTTFGPDVKVAPDYAISIALAIAGKSCGTTITAKSCRAVAEKEQLVKAGELTGKTVSRAEGYRLFLRASKLGFVDVKTINLDDDFFNSKTNKKSKEFSSPRDLKFLGQFAQTIKTAKQYNILAVFPGQKYQVALPFSRSAAASIVSKLLKAK